MIKPYSPEWWEARRGKITASSRLHVAVYGSKAEKNAMLDEMANELRPDFQWPEDTGNKYQEWGRKQEPKARQLIELLCDWDTYDPGFLCHPNVPILAATPDFMALRVGPDVAGEIKCPFYLKRHFQLATLGLLSKRLDPYMQKYYTQLQGQMLVTGAHHGVFFSYHPDAPRSQMLYREDVEVDLALHGTMIDSCAELEAMLKMGRRYGVGTLLDDSTDVPQVF